jgi:hypothetical protein
MMNTTEAVRVMTPFIDKGQMQAIEQNCQGEEGEWFREKLNELAGIIARMPQPYETDGQGNKAIVHLHYFTGGWDWYVIEKDSQTDQYQAFGLVVGFEPELGYICLPEILECGAELDLHWEPKTLAEVRTERGI